MTGIAIKIPTEVFMWTYVFSSPECVSRSGIAGSCGDSIFNYFQELPDYFPKKIVFHFLQHCFPFSPAVNEHSELPHPHKPALAGHLLHSGHSRRCEVGSHCDFNLHLSDD